MRIKADLRALILSQPTTPLTDKFFAGSSSLTVGNGGDFSTNDYILIGILGLETTEIRQIASNVSNTFTLNSATSFDHPQDTLVTKVPYNQIAFYRAST